jgi:TrmH family RNA methyltransferase
MERTEALTSPANPLLKDIRRAVARGGLTGDGYMVAEGPHLLEEALRSDVEIRVILAADSAQERFRRPAGARMVVVDDSVFGQLADTEATQGVIALVKPPVWTLEQALEGPTLAVVLDGVQDPGNAGAIVRAAEAFGATGVLFSRGTVSPFNPKTLRASAGSLFRLPFVQGIDPATARVALDARRCAVYAAVVRNGKPAGEADLSRDCALVIGSEAHGVSEAWTRGAASVSIPTAGVESLNAAVAAGILLYEARRQRSAT